MKEFREQVDLADKTDAAKRSIFQNKVLDLARRLEAFNTLDNSFRPLPFPQMPSEEEIKKDPETATQTAMEIRDLLKKMPAFHAAVMKMQLPMPVPSASGDGVWQPFGVARSGLCGQPLHADGAESQYNCSLEHSSRLCAR